MLFQIPIPMVAHYELICVCYFFEDFLAVFLMKLTNAQTRSASWMVRSMKKSTLSHIGGSESDLIGLLKHLRSNFSAGNVARAQDRKNTGIEGSNWEAKERR